MVWIILGMISIALLLFSWKKKSAVWGGIMIGAIVGFIIRIISAVNGKAFIWDTIWKAAIIGALLGFLAELLGMAGDRLKKT